MLIQSIFNTRLVNPTTLQIINFKNFNHYFELHFHFKIKKPLESGFLYQHQYY